MNRKHISTRKRRENYKRYSVMVSILISVVALVECLVLLSFTTYSWIESSSSLIISTGKDGVMKMHVADNLNYQVLVSLDAAGNVDITDDSKYNPVQGDGGYFRSVRYFNYARTSSPDGKTFYFKKTNGDNTNPYRAGDTADYNTSYTYFDFVLKNTTRSTKSFYFRSNEIFTINGHSSWNSMTSDEKIIANAMRISIQKDNGSADVYSIKGANSKPVNSTTGSTVTEFATRNITTGHYVYTGNTNTDVPLFTSTVDNNEESVENNISVRVWFDETDSSYRALSGAAKTAFDATMAAAEITLNFSLINDNVDYDQIYFDDFAYSHMQSSLGKFVTEESGGSMYFHAWNQKQNAYVNYPMSKVANPDNDAVRWMASLPIPHTVEERNESGSLVSGHDYLTNSSNGKYSGAYFFFGSASSTGDPTSCRYKWPLSTVGTMAIVDKDHAGRGTSNDYYITDATRYFRNLGVVRSSDSVSSNITGFMQFSGDSSGAMNMVYLRDRATGLTESGYNVSNTSTDIYNYQYITNSIKYLTVQSQSSSGGTDYTTITGYENIYYADIPKDAKVMFHYGNYTKQTSGDGIYCEDGTCYHPGSNIDGGKTYSCDVYETGVDLPKLNDATQQYIRIYFYNDKGWDTPIQVHTWASSLSGPDIAGTSITEMEGGTVEVTEDTLRSDNIYLNTSATAAATATVGMYFDTDQQLFKAYVPASWLTGGFYAHYNTLNFAYDDGASDLIRWNTGAVSSYDGTNNIYTLLGYTDAQKVASLSAGTGVGTWNDVRELSFATELIDSKIASAYRYKVGFGSGAYPMVPDNLCLTFKAYVPADSTSLGNIAFTRYGTYNSSTVTGTWTPTETIGSEETTYYAVDANGSANSNQGWFHVAVLVDGTFENLINDTITNDGGSLRYSYEENANFSNPVQTDSRHWVVPMMSEGKVYSTVYFRWTPYTGTVFNYVHSTDNGIYCMVTE